MLVGSLLQLRFGGWRRGWVFRLALRRLVTLWSLLVGHRLLLFCVACGRFVICRHSVVCPGIGYGVGAFFGEASSSTGSAASHSHGTGTGSAARAAEAGGGSVAGAGRGLGAGATSGAARAERAGG